MTKHQQVITVVGGTGFIGRYVVQSLAKAGFTLRVISRNPTLALRLKTAGNVGQVVLQYGDVTRPETLAGKFDGSFAVINLTGALKPAGRNRFDALHHQAAKHIAELATKAGVQRLVHFSAIGAAEDHPSEYARSKAAGEIAVRAAFPAVTILRPSVVFGPEDNFYNLFACLSSVTPALPLIGGGKTLFQPAYVVDVADAVTRVLADPTTVGKLYELAGPKTQSLKEVIEYTLHATNRKKRLISLPFPLAALLGTLTGWLPFAPITADQVRLLKTDNIPSSSAKGFAQLGIQPISPDAIVAGYLTRYRARNGADAVAQPSEAQA